MKYIIELTADTKGLQPGVDALEQIGTVSKENAEQFKKTNEELKKVTSSVDQLSKGFKETGQAAAGAFGGKALEGAAKQAESFRTQLRMSRDELVRMMQAGQLSTGQIYKMAKGAGELKDQVGDAQKVISVLASDTFKLDAALQGIQTGIAGFQVMQGAAALFGSESEDLQKTLVKLNAVMAITNGLKQIQDALQKESAFSLGLEVAAQEAYAFVVGTSTGALKAFRIALAATGIGLAIVAIAALVENWDKLKASITGSSKSLKDFNKELDKRKDATQNYISLYEKQLKLEVLAGRITEEEAKKRMISYKNSIVQQYDSVKKQQALVDDLKAKYGEYYDYQKSIGNKDILREEAKLEEIKKLKLDEVLSLKESEVDLAEFQQEQKEKALEKQKEINQQAIDNQIERYNQEIQLLRASGSEFDKNSVERFEIEKKILENEKKIALLEAKTYSDKLKAENDYNEKLLQLRKELGQDLKDIEIKPEKGSEEWYNQQIAAYEELASKVEIGSDKFLIYTNKVKDLKEELAKLLDKVNEVKNPLADLTPKPQGKTIDEINKERIEKEKAYQKMAIELAQETADTIFKIVNDARNAEYESKIAQLEKERDNELRNKNLSENQKDRINEKYNKKIAEQKTRQAEADKKAAITQAIINGALAIVKLWVNPGFPAAIPLAITTAAMTAAQIAVISAQKIPKFAKGTNYVSGPGTETSDSIPAMLSKGERVVPAHINKLLNGIPNEMLPEMLMPSKTMISPNMDYDKMAKAFSKELASNPQLMVNFDRRGFETFIKNGNTTQQIKNSRNDF